MAIVLTGLQRYWNSKDGVKSGNTFANITPSGAASAMNLVGSPTYNAGDGSVTLSGTGQSLTFLADTPFNTLGASWTLEYLFTPINTASSVNIFGGQSYAAAYIDATYSDIYQGLYQSASWEDALNATIVIPELRQTNMVHITYRYNASTNVFTVFVNGVSAYSNTMAADVAFAFGSSTVSFGDNYNAKFHALRMYNVALSDPDVATNVSNGADLGLPAADTTPPAEVTGVSSTATSSSVTLNWTNPADADFSHVKVLRGATVVGDNITGTTFTDTGLTESTNYTYYIVTVDDSNNESAGVQRSQQTTAAADPNPPGEVTAVQQFGTTNSTHIMWTNPTSANFASVKVFRDNDVVGENITDGKFDDVSRNPDTEYYYTVVTVSNDGVASPGTSVTVSTKPVPSQVKSGNLEPDIPWNFNKVYGEIQTLGLNTIALPLRIDITDVAANFGTLNAESKANAIQALSDMASVGVNVIIVPFPWIDSGNEGETEWNPANPALWFQNWKITLDEIIDDVTEFNPAWLFEIGTNFGYLQQYEDEWEDLLRHVQLRFNGYVTYRTNWWYTSVLDANQTSAVYTQFNRPYYQYVDVLTVDTFFELSDDQNPSKEQIKLDLRSTRVWDRQQDVIQELEDFHNAYDKNIIFCGFGIPARDYALNSAWSPFGDGENVSIQRNAFKAYRELLEIKTWFSGFSIWSIATREDTRYHVMGKPAEYTIKSWYVGDPLTDTTPPAEVGSLAETHTSKSVTLTWSNPVDVGFSHVNIYRDNQIIAATDASTFIDKGAVEGTSYVYKVVTEDYSGNESAGVTINVTTNALDPVNYSYYLKTNGINAYLSTPAVQVTAIEMDILIDPTQTREHIYFDNRTEGGFFVAYTGFGYIYGQDELSTWNGTVEANAVLGIRGVWRSMTLEAPTASLPIDFFRASYGFYMKADIYRLTGYNGTTKVFEYDMTTGTLLDQTGNGNHATAHMVEWVEQLRSDVTPPAEVSNLTETHSVTSVNLSWTNPTDTDFDFIKIFRDNVQIATNITGTSFIDSGLTGNTSYVYKIVTRDVNGNDSPGSIVNITTTDPNAVKPAIQNIKAGNVITGVNLDTAQLQSDIDNLNLNTIVVPIQIDVINTTSNTGTVNLQSKANAIAAIDYLQGQGINVLLSPYVSIAQGASDQADWNPANKTTWFTNWTNIISNLVSEIASPKDIWGIEVGSNFNYMESMETEMSTLITTIKHSFSGYTTYKSSWWYTASWDAASVTKYNDLLGRAFWNDVDFISFDAWFELSTDPSPTKSEVLADLTSTSIWERGQNVIQELENFNTTWGKQVFFGALGIPSKDTGLTNPWNPDGELENVGIQRNGFQAYREKLEEESWFGGFSVWFVGWNGAHRYRVTDKPAQYTIANWYEGNPTADTTAPSNVSSLNGVTGDTTVNLTWNNPASSDFSHVNIYRDNQYIGATASGSFADQGLTLGETYVYLLTTEDISGNESAGAQLSATTGTPIDATPPAEVTNANHSKTSNSVTLTWTKPTDSDFSHIVVLRDNVQVGTNLTGTSFSDTGRSPSTTYQYVIRTVDTTGNASNGVTLNVTTNAAIDTTPPANISGFNNTRTTTSIAMSWNNPNDSDFSHVRVYRNGALIGDNISSGNYTDNNLVHGTSYAYSIRSVDESGNESNGFGVTLSTLVDSTPPAEVTNLSKSYNGMNVTLSWVNPSDVDFSHTAIYRNGVEIVGNVSGTMYTDSIPSENVEYVYSVRTVDDADNMSAGVQTSAIITTDTTPPDNVSGLSASKTSTAVTLTWVNPVTGKTIDGGNWDETSTTGETIDGGTFTDSTTGQTIDGGNFTDETNNDFSHVVILRGGTQIATGITGETFTDTGRNPNTTYNYTVKSVDNSNNQSSGVSINVTTEQDSTPPGNVTSVSDTKTQNTINLSWVNPTDGDFSHIKILRNGVQIGGNITGTSYSDTGRSPGTLYTYVIKSVDTAGNESAGVTRSVTTLADTTPPAEVTSLSETHTANSVSLSWINPTDSDFSHVRILRNSVEIADNVTGRSFSDTGRASGTSYTYQVKTVDLSGNESSGLTINVTTSTVGDTTPPGNVSGVTSTKTSNSVSLSWVNPVDADFSHVKILRNGTLLVNNIIGTNHNDLNLSQNTTYNYELIAVDDSGNEAPGVTTSVTTDVAADTTPPAEVTNIANTKTSNSITLTWMNPGDADFSHVRVLRNNTVIAASVTSGTYTDSSLSPATTYEYRFQTVDTTGNQSSGVSTQVTTRLVGGGNTPTSNVISVGQMTMIDLNDAIISGEEPANPSVGTLWVDESEIPYPVLKKWNGSSWEHIMDLVEDLGSTIIDITETLGNMANDDIIDYMERQVIKDKLTEILGFVIADSTASLPTSTTLDNSIKGRFYAIRKSALNAGLSASHAKYVATATHYNNLRAYLNAMTPVKPWDVRTINKDQNISVIKADFRDRWLKYYTAIEELATETAKKLKENVDNIQVSGRNLIISKDVVNGYLVNGVLSVVNTAITTGWIAVKEGDSVIFNTYGQASQHRIEYYNPTKQFVSRETPVSLEPVIRVMPAGVGWVRWSPDSTTPYEGLYKVEKGTIPTGWSLAPEDYEERFTDVYFQISEDQITQKVMTSQTFTQTINALQQDIANADNSLIKNPAITEDTTGWTGSATAVEMDFFGTPTTVLQIVDASATNGSTSYSEYFDVDPAKMYEITAWFRSSIIPNNGGSTYLGLNAQDENGATMPVESILNSTGVVDNTASTNFYFWSTTDTESLEDWVKITAYILPAGFDEADAQNISRNATRSARMKSNTRRIRLRWLNYYNYEVQRTLWMAHPRVAEMSSGTPTTGRFDIISNKIDSVEQIVSSDGIETIIENSITFENALAQKADADSLGDFVTRNELENFDEDMAKKISDSIADIDFSPYATKLELSEKSTEILAKFHATGGMNLLKNSIGYAGFDFWKTIGGSNIQTMRSTDLNTLGFGSGYSFNTNTSWSRIEQEVPVVAGVPYTLSWYLDKPGTDGDFWIQFLEEGVTMKSVSIGTSTTTEGFKDGFANYVPTSNLVTVRIMSHAAATITGLMFTIGDTPLQWTLATGELYNTNIRMDINGIRVSQVDENGSDVGFTSITPDEFAGYYKSKQTGQYEKIFELNDDEVTSKKGRFKEEITMGKIKIIKHNSGGNSGWAFIPIIDTDE